MKHLLTIVVVFVLHCIASAQEIKSEDIYQYSGSFNSHECFHRNATGGYYIAGKGTGSIDFDHGPGENTLPESSDKDLYLAYYNNENALQLLHSFDGDQTTNQIVDMVSDEDGNLYVAGTFTGTLNLTTDGQNAIVNSGESSTWIAKFAMNGTLVWHFTLGDTNFEQSPQKLFVVGERLIVQLAYSGEFDVDPGPGVSTLDGSSNAMLEYDLDGNLINAYSHRGGTGIEASAFDMEGNLYLAGSFSGLARFDFKTNASVFAIGLFDAYVVKYDSDFNLLWFKRIVQGGEALRFYQLAFDENSDPIAVAEFVEGVTIGEFTTENEANFLVHLSKEGDFTDLTEILPKSCEVTDLFINEKQQIILNTTFSEEVDTDLSEGIEEHIPMADHDNLLIAIYESDLSLYDSKQIYAPRIETTTLEMDTDGKVDVLIDFEGEGKPVYGNNGNYNAQNEEDFVHYRVNIQGCNNSEGQLTLEGCEALEVNGVLIEESGSYEQVLVNSEGCDSVLILNITIHPVYSLALQLQACDSFEIDGMVYTETGNYTVELTSYDGCDSIISLALDVVNINTEVGVEDMQLISEELDADSYQWYDCATDQFIENATNRNFSPEESGQYKVEIVKESCIKFSECVEFNIVNTEDFQFEFYFAPNPTQGLLSIHSDLNMDEIQIQITDLSGRVVHPAKKYNGNSILDLNHLSSGVYMVQTKIEDQINYRKIVVY